MTRKWANYWISDDGGKTFRWPWGMVYNFYDEARGNRWRTRLTLSRKDDS
jgi:hypothetical protein